MDLWTQQNSEGISPNVANQQIKPKATSGEKALWIVFWILSALLFCIPMIVYYFRTKNLIINEQNMVNNCSSSIQVSQEKRFNVLTDLIEQVRSHYKFEESVYAQISENRNLIKSSDNVVSRQNALDNLSVLLNAQFENYPELKSAHLIRDLMSQSSYLENEIAASRRTYNSYAQKFNALIQNFPVVCVSEKMKTVTTVPIFSTSETKRDNVKNMASLSDW